MTDLLLKCSNESFVSKQDKKYIRMGDAPLERSNLYYLMHVDTELRDL